jgi:Flp pilus assembly protein TadD
MAVSSTPAKKAPAPGSLTRSNVNGKDVSLALLLFGILLMAYMPALGGGLVWDDDAHVTKPALQSMEGLWRIWTSLGSTQQYYPLMHSVFWLEHVLWADFPVGYHLADLLFHFLSSLLLVAILRRLLIPGAWLAAFLFALHPVQVESAAWISEQKGTLSAVFYLASLYVYLDFDRARERKRYWVAFALFVAAILTKSVTATLPVVLLIVLWWKRGKLDFNKDVGPLVPWVAVGGAMGLFTAWVERRYIGAEGAAFSFTLLERTLLAGRVFWFYLSKLFWPANLSFVYPRWTIGSPAWQFYLALVGMIGLGTALFVYTRRNRTLLACYLFFVVTLFPALGFFNVYPFKYSFVADHFQYLATLGVLVPCAAGLTILGERLGDTGRKAGLAVLIAVLFFLSWDQSGWYRDAYTLYTRTIERNPDAWMAHNELGLILGRVPNRVNEGIEHLQAAKRLQPESAEILNNLGVVLSDLPNRAPDAVTELQAAIKLKPDYAEAYNNLGSALAEIPGRKDEAIPAYRAAISIDPNYADAHNNLGSALSEKPEWQPEAIRQFEDAVRLNPKLAEAQANLGIALAKTDNRTLEAVPHLQAALELRPDMDQVRELLSRMGH